MDNRQLDLFAPAPSAVSRSEPPVLDRPAPAALSDEALIAALSELGQRSCPALATEIGRRKLPQAVPVLAMLCRRFAGWGSETALVPEQAAALEALRAIGGKAAAAVIIDGIVKAIFLGPTLGIAVAACAALGATLPEAAALRLLRHNDADLRADACRCAPPSPAVISVLVELLDDLHPAVLREAACALGRHSRSEARPMLRRLLESEPTPDIIGALGIIADEDCLILLRRMAERVPSLADCVLDALETSDHPRATALAATLQAPA